MQKLVLFFIAAGVVILGVLVCFWFWPSFVNTTADINETANVSEYTGIGNVTSFTPFLLYGALIALIAYVLYRVLFPKRREGGGWGPWRR